MRIRSTIFLTAALILMLGFATAASAGGDHRGFGRFIKYLIAQLAVLDFDRYQWTEVNPGAPWAPRAGLEAVELGGRFYVMGGRTPLPPPAPPFASIIQRDVWVSEDRGVTWEPLGEAPWPARAFFEAVTKDGYMYVMGGQSFDLACPFPGCTPDQQVPVSNFYNDVYRSTDGVVWEQMTDDAPWAPRAGLSAVVHRGWIYVFAGAFGDDPAIGGSGRTFFTDVHKSRDGRRWIKVADDVPWPGRGGASAISKNGKIYLMGGEDGFLLPPYGDVWSSRSGRRWKLENPEAWQPRSGHKCGVIVGHILCFGGFNLAGNPMDVQVSYDGRHWRGLDPEGPAAPPWLADFPEDIKYDFDIIVTRSEHPKRRGIYTFGGDRESFDLPPDGPPGPPEGPPPGFGEEVPDLRVDNDVWRFAPPQIDWHAK